MELTGTQCKALCTALCEAFPTRMELAEMIRFELNLNLSEISSDNDNLEDAVFKLVEWCDGQGRISELSMGACKENQGNSDLQAIAQEIKRTPDLQEPKAPPVAAQNAGIATPNGVAIAEPAPVAVQDKEPAVANSQLTMQPPAPAGLAFNKSVRSWGSDQFYWYYCGGYGY